MAYLDEAQQDKIFMIQHAAAPQLRAYAKAIRKSHEELHALSLSTQYSDAKAKAIADGGARAETDFAVLRAHADNQIYMTRNAEQRKQADESRMRFDQRRGSSGMVGTHACWHTLPRCGR